MLAAGGSCQFGGDETRAHLRRAAADPGAASCVTLIHVQPEVQPRPGRWRTVADGPAPPHQPFDLVSCGLRQLVNDRSARMGTAETRAALIVPGSWRCGPGDAVISGCHWLAEYQVEEERR